MTKRPTPTSGMTFRGEKGERRGMGSVVTNCALIVVVLLYLGLLAKVEPSQAVMISLLLGIFFVFTGIYLKLKEKE